MAPTGSGKTLAAFLVVPLNALLADALAGRDLAAGVHVLYVSPLRALNYDSDRNLQRPMEGIRAAARELGLDVGRLTSAVRTGGTTGAERQRMVRRPPQILITTLESLFAMLTSSRARAMLRAVRYVIVDEIHAIAGSKRGAHLSLTLERLERLTARPFQRIGLSATQRPLPTIAAFLGGREAVGVAGEFRARPVQIVDLGVRRDIDLRVDVPVEDLRNLPGGSVWPSGGRHPGTPRPIRRNTA